MAQLDNKVVLITGGAHGFGRVLALTLARAGANIAIADTGRSRQAHQFAVEPDLDQINGVVKEEPGRANPTMWPLAGTGPYYAALVTGGTLDTKGGPKATPDGQVLDDQDRPIPGLYGVGNCVASASAQAYWAGGATLGPILALAHRAATAADTERVAAPQPVSQPHPERSPS